MGGEGSPDLDGDGHSMRNFSSASSAGEKQKFGSSGNIVSTQESLLVTDVGTVLNVLGDTSASRQENRAHVRIHIYTSHTFSQLYLLSDYSGRRLCTAVTFAARL